MSPTLAPISEEAWDDEVLLLEESEEDAADWEAAPGAAEPAHSVV